MDERSARLQGVSSNFEYAVRRAQELEKSGQLSTNRIVALYGLLMQATAGDCQTSKPPPSVGGIDEGANLKWMAWKKKHGMSREQAMMAYIDQLDLIDEELTTGGAALMDSTGAGASGGAGGGGIYNSGEIYTSSDAITKTGILYKQRDVFKGWRPRTFVLSNKLLTYYLHENDPLARNTLILEGCRVQPIQDAHYTKKMKNGDIVTLYPFSISHPESHQEYHLATTDDKEADEWIRALKKAASSGVRRVSLRRKTSLETSRIWRRPDSIGSSNDLLQGDSGGGGLGIEGLGGSGLPFQHISGGVPGANMSYVPAELAGKVSRAMQALLENTSSYDHWDVVSKKNEVQVYRRLGVNNSVRGEGLIKDHPVSVLLAVMDLARREAYDSHFEFGRRVKMYNAHTSLDYHHYKAAWPTAARDMYNIVHWQVLDTGTIVIVSFADEDRHPDEDGCVRAECILAGWVIRPIYPLTPTSASSTASAANSRGKGDDGRLLHGYGSDTKAEDAGYKPTLTCQVSFLLQTDLKGTLPHRIKNQVSESQAFIIVALRKFLADHHHRYWRNGAGARGGRGGRRDEYAALHLETYSNFEVEQMIDNLNRRVLANESAPGLLTYLFTYPALPPYLSKVEQMMDNLNRRVLASESAPGLLANGGGGGGGGKSIGKGGSGSNVAGPGVGSGLILSKIKEGMTSSGGGGSGSAGGGGAGGGGAGGAGGGGGPPSTRRALHQRPLTMREIQSMLAPQIDAQVEDAVNALIERETSFPFHRKRKRSTSLSASSSAALAMTEEKVGEEGEEEEESEEEESEENDDDGWELFDEREGGLLEFEEHDGAEGGKKKKGKRLEKDRSYMNEKDATDVSVLRICSEGIINHPPVAVLKAITTLDLVNIWSSAIEFSTHDFLHNVHTWVTYQRLKAMFPMPTRDVCQLNHWRVHEDHKRIVIIAVDDANSHPEEDGYVRAHQNEGWVLDTVNEGQATRVFCIFSLDIKGIMTKAIRRDLAENQAAVISSIRKFLDEYLRGYGATNMMENGGLAAGQLDAIEISNEALQPLVVAWNRWSPTLIPDRIHIRGEEAKQRKAMDDAAATTLALMRQASADQHLQHFHHHPSSISSSAAAGGGIGGGRLGLTKPPMSRSASAPATSLMAGRGRPPRLGPSSLAQLGAPLPPPPPSSNIMNSGSSTSSVRRSSSPVMRAIAEHLPIAVRPAPPSTFSATTSAVHTPSRQQHNVKFGTTPIRNTDTPPPPILHEEYSEDRGRRVGGGGGGTGRSPARSSLHQPLPAQTLPNKEEAESTCPLISAGIISTTSSSSSSLSIWTLLLVLLSPVAFYYTSLLPTQHPYRGLFFLVGVTLAVRYVVIIQSRATIPSTSAPSSTSSARGGGGGQQHVHHPALPRRTSEWGQDGIKSRVQVRFPVEVRRIKRYIEAKQRENGGMNITVLHVAMRALGVAMKQTPELNGHQLLGSFFYSPTADASCELRLKDGTFALIKVPEVDHKSVADISRTIASKSQALSTGQDPIYRRGQFLRRWCPPLLAPLLDAFFSFLGSGLGLQIPLLGIRAFPQKSLHCESDFIVEPDPTASRYIAPMVMTIGAITSIPKVEGHQQMIMVPVLNLSLIVQLHHQGGQIASLQHVRRLTDLLHKYMADPRQLDVYDEAHRRDITKMLPQNGRQTLRAELEKEELGGQKLEGTRTAENLYKLLKRQDLFQVAILPPSCMTYEVEEAQNQAGHRPQAKGD